MNEPVSADDLAFGYRIRDLADAAVPRRDPHAVAEAAVQSPRPGSIGRWAGLVAATTVAVAALAFAVASLSSAGSSPATAQVGGVTIGDIHVFGIDVGDIHLGGTSYGVGVARNIDLAEARLVAVGEARQNGGFITDGPTVYQVDDVDPLQVLVMRLVPGQRDDAGLIGDFLVLVRGDGYTLLCPYYAADDPLAPSTCD